MSAPTTFGGVLRSGFRLIARFIKARPGGFAIAFAGSLTYAASILASSRVIGWVTDTVILDILERGAEAAGLLWKAAAAVMAVSLAKSLGVVTRRVGAGWLQLKNRQDLRRRFVGHVLKLDMDWYNRQAVGNLISIGDADVSGSTFLLGPLPFALGATLLLIGTIVLVFILDPLLGVIAMGFIVVVVIIELRGAWVTFGLVAEIQARRGELAAAAHESFDGALTVKALGREQWETDRFTERSDRLRERLINITIVWESFKAAVQNVPAAAQIVIITFGVFRLADGLLTAGDIVSVAYLLSLLFWPIQLIGFVFFDLAASSAHWERIEAVFREQTYVRYGQTAAVDDDTGAAVSAAAVGFGYDETPVLTDVDIEIPPGRIVAVVGPTGSGKTTLAVLLARLWDPRTGAIRLDERDLRDMAAGALPDEMAYVAQEAFLFDDTVRGNITLGVEVPDADVRRAADLANATPFVDELESGFDTQIGERGTTLSGGQRQRVALARALLRRPRLLILDDATSAVDPSVESRILHGLREADLPSTVVLVAYRASSIALSDEVLFVEDGRIVAAGPHDELLEHEPGYQRLLKAYEEDAAARAGGGA